MHVTGFTIVRNAVKYDYPVIESISSVLPLCDEFLILAGNSDDNTTELIRNSLPSNKIRIVNSIWDESIRKGGKLLAQETNKAILEIPEKSNWAFYIQADEVLHEKYLEPLKKEMIRWKDDPRVQGLLFDYIHFFGSYDYIADSRNWYRKEVRIIRPGIGIKSWKDAQGFRLHEKPLNVKPANAGIYHYGWVKPPDKQQEKQKYFNKLWHDDKWIQTNVSEAKAFDYSIVDSVRLFDESHPEIMKIRVSNAKWETNINPGLKKLSLRFKILMWIEKITGYRIGEYKNYKILK